MVMLLLLLRTLLTLFEGFVDKSGVKEQYIPLDRPVNSANKGVE
jgi:hypothetical protein